MRKFHASDKCGPPGVFARGEDFVRVEDVDKVMGNATPFGERGFGRPDVEMAIDLQRIAVDDFTMELQQQSE